MPYKTIVNFINGAVRTASEFYEDVTETVRAVTPEPIGKALDVLAGTVERGVAKSPIGVAERGAAATGQMVSRSTGNKVLGGAVEIGLGVAAGGPAVGSAAKRVIPKGVPKPKPAAPPIDRMMPPGMAPAMAGAAPMPTPVSIRPNIKGGSVFMSTTSPEWTSPKAGLGSAADPKYAPAVERFEAREAAWQEVIDTLKKSYEAGNISEAKLKREISEIQSIRKGDLSTFDYDPENLYAFFEGLRESPYAKQTRKRGELKAFEAARTQDPYDVLFKAHQHHVLAKAETKPFVETLMRLMNEGVANKDDLVNFFVWPEKYDLFPGNVRKNLLDMGAITHTTAKKDPMALHNLLKEAGLEYGSRTNPEMVKRYGLDKVTSADELMQAYDRYLQEIAIPSRDIAYKAQDWWYNKTIKTLKGKELAEFKANFAKLRDPRRSP